MVTDASGRFVPGLTAADFEIREEGRRQRIEFFQEVSLPIPSPQLEATRERAATPDTASNETASSGRVYLILLDDLHVAIQNTVPVRQAARLFVERYVGPDDLVAVAYTSGRTDAGQDFTSNRQALLAAIEPFGGQALPPAAAEKARNYELGLGARDFLVEERLARSMLAYQTIGRLVEHLSSAQGRRKALVLFSEGTYMPDGVRRPNEAFEDPRRASLVDAHQMRRAVMQVVSAATRANVYIYPVDPRGLGLASFDVTLQIPMDREAVGAGVTLEAFDEELLGGQRGLHVLAELTRGRAIVGPGAIEDGLSRIVHDGSQYYLLGYSPSPAPREGRFTALAVQVLRPSLQVSARPGYYAARPDPPRRGRAGDRPLEEALAAAVPRDGLPMRVATAAFRDTPKRAAVLIAIDLPASAFMRDVPTGDLLLAYAITDTTRPGRPVAANTITLRLPEAAARISTGGFRMLLRLALPPGRYHARFAARAGGPPGSVFADMHVPDFFGQPLAWSGISVNSVQASRTPTHALTTEVATALPVPPTAVRSFAVGDTIAAYAVAYGDGEAGAAVELEAIVRSAQGTTVFTHVEQRTDDGSHRDARGRGFRVDIPTANLPPGEYVLTLSAVPRAGGRMVWRDVPFEVVR